MSGFAGLLNLDGAAVDPARLEAMATRLAYRSPDGLHRFVDGAIGMAHGHFWTTPEEVGEQQPIGDPDRSLWLAADARVDNRPELLSALPGLAPEVSDARLLLAAYSRFGDELCDKVVGDFSFALWDGARRRLLLARDAMGLRQLYYARRGPVLVFGNTIGSVLAGLAGRPPLNRNLIEAFLQDSYRHWIHETVHQGLFRVPPGHFLAADADGPRLRRWWTLGSTYDGGHATDEQWIDGFRELHTLAVRCRLRSTTPIGLLAGGGVDSATVASAAYSELGRERADRLRLIGLTFDGTPTADEGEYFDELAAWLGGVEAHRIPAEQLPLSLGRAPGDDHPLDEPEVYLLRSHTTALFADAARAGCRVVLAGEGANQVLQHSFYYDPAALRLVDWRDLGAELPRFRDTSGVGTLKLLARGYLSPLVPPRLRERLRRLTAGRGRRWVRQAGRGSWRRRLPPPLERGYAVSLAESPSGRWASQAIGRPHDLARYSAIEVTAAHAGVEWRLPFLDRRLADFLMHVPRHLCSWREDDRRILRRAMVGAMPERIRLRRSKSHIQEVLDRRLRHEQREAVRQLLDKPRAQAIDCITGSVAAAFDSYWNGSGTAYALLSFLCLESWLRENSEEVH